MPWSAAAADAAAAALRNSARQMPRDLPVYLSA
jgi:hypothetical protein